LGPGHPAYFLGKALFLSLSILSVERIPLRFVGARGMVSRDDARESAARGDQKGLELRRELVEEMVSSVSEDY
jgi:hypothetical protein